MLRGANKLQITVIDSMGEHQKLSFFRNEYPNLMELIINTYYEEIGDCKGIALCGTCIVETIGEQAEEQISTQEEHTLKVTLTDEIENRRLACQIMLTENIHGFVFKVLGNL